MRRLLWAVVLAAGWLFASSTWVIAVEGPPSVIVQGGDDTDPGDDDPDDDLDPPDLTPNAVGDTQVYQEYAERMRSAELVTPLGSNVFGESVNLFDGATTFNATDIDIPGNSELPVRLQRRFEIKRVPQFVGSEFGGVGNWDIDVPSISGVFPPGDQWGHFTATGTTTPRCNTNYSPTVGAPFERRDVWAGNTVHLPGQGDKEVLYAGAGFGGGGGVGFMVPTSGGPHRWVTRDRDYLSCAPTIANGVGEGFILHTPDGMKYTFDFLATRNAGSLGQVI